MCIRDRIYTGGTSFSDNEILDRSINFIKTNRGGKITYHGPGQLVFYFVIDLNKRGKKIKKIITAIEKTIINTLKNYDIKFQVKPGLSGWAQVNYHYGATFDDSMNKLGFDIYYVKNFSIIFDLIILFKTINLKQALIKIMSSTNHSSKEWVLNQYDRSVMGDTVADSQKSDSAIIRIHNTNKAVAITCDCNPLYCNSDPYQGALLAVTETWRNLCASGAMPMAITDNLNFGNPEKKEIMFEIVESIKGISEACKKLKYPVVSGNVSLYNETEGKSIYPTPVIGLSLIHI